MPAPIALETLVSRPEIFAPHNEPTNFVTIAKILKIIIAVILSPSPWIMISRPMDPKNTG